MQAPDEVTYKRTRRQRRRRKQLRRGSRPPDDVFEATENKCDPSTTTPLRDEIAQPALSARADSKMDGAYKSAEGLPSPPSTPTTSSHHSPSSLQSLSPTCRSLPSPASGPPTRFKQPGYLLAMPNEILLEILRQPSVGPSEVSRLARTCRRLGQLADDPTLWRVVSLEPFRSIIDDTTMSVLCVTRFASIVGSASLRLQSLDLSGCSNITDQTLHLLAEHCPGLQALSLSGCNKITSTGVRELAAACRKLSRLELKFCEDVGDTAAFALALHARGLQRIDLTWTTVTDEGVCALARSCPALQVVALSCNAFVTDHAARELIERCPRLRSLDLGLCDHITDATLDAVIEHGHALEEINVVSTSVTPEGLHAFLQRGRKGTRVTSL